MSRFFSCRTSDGSEFLLQAKDEVGVYRGGGGGRGDLGGGLMMVLGCLSLRRTCGGG